MGDRFGDGFSVPASMASLGGNSTSSGISGYLGLDKGNDAGNAMASGYGSEFKDKLRHKSGGGNPVTLAIFFLVAVFVTYNVGYYSTLTFHNAGGDASSDPHDKKLGAGLDSCTLRTKQAQVGFFSNHACWFNISRRPDWVATRMFFQTRAQASKKGMHLAGADDKCGFISIGTGSYDPNPTFQSAYQSDKDARTKMQIDDYVANMKATNVFDQCYTFTYTQEQDLPIAQTALAGTKMSLVRPLWTDADTTLDVEFEKIGSAIVEGTIVVKSHLRSFESDLLAGFKTGLASGRVGAVIWEREVAEAKHVRSLKDEMEFVSSFGYAVYLASAQEAEMSQNFQRVYKPSAFLRIDRGLWDSTYAIPNAKIVLTVVAVKQDHPFRVFLDSNQALCPITLDKTGQAKCDCQLEKYDVASEECSLANLVTHTLSGSSAYGNQEWRQPLTQPRADIG